MTEQQLVAAARDGDESAFGELVDAHRSGLYVHCYRMLGSPQDAEDALQEALLRAWRGLPRFAGRSSLRSWLYSIATNAALRLIERRPRRVLPVDYGPATADPHAEIPPPLTESVWIEPLPDTALGYEQRETVELAFVAALQLLPARQRAVLILRDVLGFSAPEVAAALETTPVAIHSALQRAHATIGQHLPERSQQAALQALDDTALRTLVDSYVDAWERSDVAALAALLTEDAVLSMPPHSTWFQGRDAVAAFLATRPMGDGRLWPSVQANANGQLAFGHYRVEADGTGRTPHSINVLTLREGRIDGIIAFLMPELFERFGLPTV